MARPRPTAAGHAWSNHPTAGATASPRAPEREGFVVLARRWVVERGFGWRSHWGGLARDRGGWLDVSAGRLAVAALCSGVEALINPVPVRPVAT